MVGEQDGLSTPGIVQLVDMPSRFLGIEERDVTSHAKWITVVKSGVHGQDLPICTS